MAPIIVGVDESGTHNHAPCICVAAVFGRQQQWNQLARDWGPRARYYEEHRKPYHATGALDKDNALLAQVTARWLGGLALTIDYETFQDVVTHHIKSKWGAEYQTALRAIAYILANYVHHEHIDWMTWVLEAGHSEQSAANKYLGELVERRPGFRILSFRWADKRDITTHPADVASHVFARVQAGETVPLADTLATAIRHRHWERAELEESVEKGEIFRRELAREKQLERKRLKEERRAAEE